MENENLSLLNPPTEKTGIEIINELPEVFFAEPVQNNIMVRECEIEVNREIGIKRSLFERIIFLFENNLTEEISLTEKILISNKCEFTNYKITPEVIHTYNPFDDKMTFTIRIKTNAE